MCFVCRLLTHYNVQLQYVSPPNLGMPRHIMEYLAYHGINQKEYNTLEEVLPDTDVLYMTRIQRERFTTQEEYDKVFISFIQSKTNTCVSFHSIYYNGKSYI